MSTNVTNSVDVTLDTTEVTVENSQDLVVSNTHEVDIQEVNSIVEGYKKEYSIVGDGLYASISAEDAPTWLLAIIDDVVTNSVAAGMTDYDLLVQDVQNAIDMLDVASNTYVEQINLDATINGIITTRLATLNASLDTKFATIVDLNTAITTSDAALASSVSSLQTEYTDAITAQVTTLQNAYTAADQVLADDITALETVFIDQESNLEGVSNAVSGLQTYVGLDETSAPDGTGMLASISILQKQNDGIIEYTTGTYDVMIGVEDPNTNTDNDELDVTQEPYASWIATDTVNGNQEQRSIHIGDVYIKYSTSANGAKIYEKAYKFIRTVVDNTSPYATDSEGYTWALITDTDAQQTYITALEARDLADDKRRVFVSQPTQGPYDVGDLWLVAIGDAIIGQTINGRVVQASDILRAQTQKAVDAVYSNADWVFASNYTDDQYAIDIENGTKQIDLSDHVNSLGWQTSSEVSATVNDAVSTFATDVFDTAITSINNQLDAKIESYFSDTEPFDPATGTAAQNGDIWYDTNDQLLYRYTYATTSWDRIYDQEALDAASAASTAQATADGKITTFIQTTSPTAEGIGDLWIDSDNNNKFHRWNGTTWEYLRDTSKDADIAQALSDAATAQAAADGKVTSFFQTTAPVTASEGDIWFDTDDGNTIYIYESSVWVNRQDSSIGQALLDAADAQATADGKIVTYYQDAEPTQNLTVGDLWIDTNDGNKLYRYNGTSWDYFRDDTALDNFITATYAVDKLALQNQIDGKSVSYFQNTEPYTAASGQDFQNGDVWYNTSTSELKVFKYDAVTPAWELITDPYIQGAYDDAASAQATADGKIRNFTAQPTAPYEIGDTWMEGSTGDIYVCSTDNLAGAFNAAHWVLASKYTDDSAVVLLSSGLADGTVAIDLTSSTVDGTNSIATYVSDQLDNQLVVYSGTDVVSAPTGKNDDLFIESKEVTDTAGNTYTETTIYKWVTNAWVAQTNADTSIATLADVADGKRTIYSNVSNSVPAGETNDIWIPTTGTNDATYVPGEVYQYNGTSWVLATKYSENLDTFVNTVNNTIVPALEDQIDGKIEYWFNLSTNDPKAAWTVAERTNRDGDVWYQTDTNLSFYYTSSNNSWNAIQDADALSAISAAADAQSAADGKVSQFYAWGGANAPADYTDGSVTVPANNYKYWYKVDGNLYYKPAATWVLVPTIVDSAVYIASGDLLTVFDPTTRDYTYYSYNGSSWEQNGPTGIISTSKYFVDLDAAVNGAGGLAEAQSNLELSVSTYAQHSDGVVLSGLSALDIGWTTDPTVTFAESDMSPIGGCQTALTYAQAVAHAEARGLRLPTLSEVKAGLGQGTGCSFDNQYIWTSTPGLTEGTRYVAYGDYATYGLISERDETLTGPCRFVADSHDKVSAASLHAQSKFEYNAPITINGTTYTAGFGLANSATQITNNPISSGSEFWVDADKFRLMNSSDGQYSAVFTVTPGGGVILSSEYTEATRNEPQGTYSAVASYVKGDIVTFNNSSYVALQALTGVTPTNDGVNWQLLAAQGMTALLYEWSGVVSWPVSTTEAGAIVHTFESGFSGNVTVRVFAFDAEGGVRLKLNSGAEHTMTTTLGDNTEEWYEFNLPDLIVGTNSLKFWSTTADGGSLKEIQVAFVGATGATGADGAPGAAGTPGAGFFHGGGYADISTVDATITARFTTAVGRAPVTGDTFTQEDVTNATSTKRYNGSTWEAPALIVDGSMIVNGGITADNLAATNLSGIFVDAGEITAGILRSNDSKMVIDLNSKYILITT